MQPEEHHLPATANVPDVAMLIRAIRSYDHAVMRTALLLSAHLFSVRARFADQLHPVRFEAARWQIPAERMKKQREPGFLCRARS